MAILARPGFMAAELDRSPSGARLGADVVVVSESAVLRARLTVLYAEHGGRIHRFLRDLLGDAALAADGTQETFVRAYKKLGSFEEGTKMAPWLFGIARNVSLELRKARYRAGRHLTLVPSLESLEVPGPDSPESSLLGREALRVVGRALERLPEERRAMLLLRLDHGLSYDDIATTMSCSLAKVKVEIFRAREVLREVMADYEKAPQREREPGREGEPEPERGGAR